WTRKKEDIDEFPISVMNTKEKGIAIVIFMLTIVFVIAVYFYFDKFTNWYSYLDTVLTAIFFVGMWLMAKRKIENWLFWIVGDLLSIPLYFAKGYTFTSFQYIIFTIIAVYGYLEWKKILSSSQKQERQQL
ncbi:MAG: nicotinamide riboside transporter PnuC, partial [Flavobacterium sp.]